METSVMVLNDIRALMSHLAELTTEDASELYPVPLWRVRNHLVNALSDLTNISEIDICETLRELRG